MKRGAITFAEIILAIADARQIRAAEAQDLVRDWRSKYSDHIATMARGNVKAERDAEILANAREIFVLSCGNPGRLLTWGETAEAAFNAAKAFRDVADEVLK